MDLALTDSQEMLKSSARSFIAREAPKDVIVGLENAESGFVDDLWRKACDLGWLGMLVPEEHGGGTLSGGGLADLAIVAEEFGRMVSPGPLHPTNIVAGALAASASPEQRAEVLPGIVSGDLVATWCFIEPGRGWRPSDVELAAQRRGDGFVLTGIKAIVEAAGEADWFLVTARANDGDGGLVQFLVPRDARGARSDLCGVHDARRLGGHDHDESRRPAHHRPGAVGRRPLRHAGRLGHSAAQRHW